VTNCLLGGFLSPVTWNIFSTRLLVLDSPGEIQ
jgi:hypothetical protein